MKNSLYYSITLFLCLFISNKNLSAQVSSDTTVVIKSSAECDMCVKRIEKALVFEKGVKEVKVNPEAHTVTVRYNPQKITLAKIKQLLSKAGYDADEVKADEKAFNKLPECCKKGMKELHPKK